MATDDQSKNDISTVDYGHFSFYHLFVGNDYDQHYQEYMQHQQGPSSTVPSQEEPSLYVEESLPSSQTSKDHPTPREFEKTCHATANLACERLAAETRQNVKLIEPKTTHTYRYKDAKTGEMVEKGIKPDMVVAFSHDGVRGKNVVVDAKSHKGALKMSDYDKLERDRRVTKCSYAVLFINTNTKVPKSVLEAVKKNDRMTIICYNDQQPELSAKEFVNKVGPPVSGSTFVADDYRYAQNKPYVQGPDNTKQTIPNPLGNQNSNLTKNTHRDVIRYDFQHPRKPDGSLDREHPINKGLKEDGTPDMRLNENKTLDKVEHHLTKEGELDQRFNENKSEKQLQMHQNKDGEPDHRYKENQELQPVHLKSDGTPDMRYAQNQETAAAANTEQVEGDNSATSDQAEHLKADGTPDMRYTENQETAAAANTEQVEGDNSATSDQAEHLKADGTPDMRYTENQETAAAANTEQVEGDNSATSDQAEHLKADGTPDMRYTENQETAAAANTEQVEGDNSATSDQAEHLKADGTPDMRYTENQETAAAANTEQVEGDNSATSDQAEHLKADGTPDMRYTENQETAAAANTEQVEGDNSATSDQAEYLKADGTPDMRYTENQEAAESVEENVRTYVDESETMSDRGTAVEEEYLKTDGTLDMRYTSSKETVAEMGQTEDTFGMSADMASMDLVGGGSGDDGSGPLKADGTPDMRFSANQ